MARPEGIRTPTLRFEGGSNPRNDAILHEKRCNGLQPGASGCNGDGLTAPTFAPAPNAERATLDHVRRGMLVPRSFDHRLKLRPSAKHIRRTVGDSERAGWHQKGFRANRKFDYRLGYR